VPYFLFLLVGMAAWRLFDQTLTWSTRGFDRFSKLVRTFSFPLLLVPIAASAFGWLEFGIYSALTALVFLAFLVTDGTLYLAVGPELLLGVLGLLLALGFGLGLALWLSVFNARWRDVRFSLRYVLEIWFYLTPVIYPLTQLPADVRTLAQVNPMSPIVEMVKEGFLDAGTTSPLAVAWAIVATLIALTSGVWFFANHSARFVVPDADGDEQDEDDELLGS
jgi:lipopolysaccharide transport system permease protein